MRRAGSYHVKMLSRSLCALSIVLFYQSYIVLAHPSNDAKTVQINLDAPIKFPDEYSKKAPIVNIKPINELFPHAVLFGLTCGGSIISPTWIITAGHCTLFTNGRYVLAGTNNTARGDGVRIRVKRLVIHPRFSVGPYWLNPQQYNIKQVAARYDFLLAELESPLPLDGKKIAAAKLDSSASLPAGLGVGYAGFGAANHGETMRDEMHAMSLQIQSDEVCAKLVEYDPVDMLCAQGIPPRYDSACNGDSGSGLVHEGQLLGVASWVENDAVDCHPKALVVFSRISKVREWIKQVTGI